MESPAERDVNWALTEFKPLEIQLRHRNASWDDGRNRNVTGAGQSQSIRGEKKNRHQTGLSSGCHGMVTCGEGQHPQTRIITMVTRLRHVGTVLDARDI